MQWLLGKVANGRNDSAIVRLITRIGGTDGMAAAAARLDDATLAVLSQLPTSLLTCKNIPKVLKK